MSKALTLENQFPSTSDFATMKEIGSMAIKSGFLPTHIKTPEQAVIIMMKGRELGLPPIQAFSSIAVINGKPTLSSELMLSMIHRNIPGAVVNFISTDALKCVIEAKRQGGKSTTFSFTMEDAKRAGLAGKGPWASYPAAMLRARCIAATARAMFPDALAGVVYTPEELGADVDDKGTLISVPHQEKTVFETTVVNDAPAEPLPVSEPIALHAQEKPHCRICNAEMRMSRNGQNYHCPNFEDKSKGEHTIFRVSGLKTYLEHRAAEKAEASQKTEPELESEAEPIDQFPDVKY